MDEMFKSITFICMDLWAGDVDISYEGFREEVLTRINNLKSSIGPEAHARLAFLGVMDRTGQTIEEQDEWSRQEIAKYQKILDFLDNDDNWIN